ncbi:MULTISPECIES: hypothetical protein [unclassified Clostridium]|uniref:hypothetical protein n=1 Tax=unclassified Clostridium TaxID=2614128 RepID=UPI0002972767|nr:MULTISPECIES: hypothetical protein [unclassified Clostridium]EKQ50551.1 MAG: hypothetical protein A370_05555 [Clostridium sp. Maddingley MBC34-26]
MSKENRYSNPAPEDYTVENITTTTTENPNTHKANQNNQLHSKIYSRPSEGVGEGKNNSNSSKPHPVTGSITENNDEAFEFKEYNSYRK